MRFRPLVLLVMLVVLSVVPGISGGAGAQTQLLVWSEVEGIPRNIHFQDVVMFNRTSAWAVGKQGELNNQAAEGVVYALQFANGRWTGRQEQRFTAPVNALSVIAPDNIWVVGDQGLVAHKTASGWQTVDVGLPKAELRTIQMFSAGDEGWIGGSMGYESPMVLLHYTNQQWQRDHSLSSVGRIESLHFSPEEGWAVGNSQIWHYINGAWQTEPELAPGACGVGCADYRLYAVGTINSQHTWIVGEVAVRYDAYYYMLERSNGAWKVVSKDPEVKGAPSRKNQWIFMPLKGLTFIDQQTGFAAGYVQKAGVHNYPMIFRYRNGEWSNERVPIMPGKLEGISMVDADRALAVGTEGVVLSYGYGPQPQARPYPTARVERPSDSKVTYFDTVGHTLWQPFTEYWQKNGGLAVFGYPLTEQFGEYNTDVGEVYTVQYLERQRYEFHFENKAPYDVLLGRLGVEVLAQQGRDWQTFPKGDPAAAHYYPETGHAIAPEFWDYWQTHGLDLKQPGVTFAEALALFGYPISEPQMETNANGDRVLTQWFERARFEYHPNNPAEYRVLLGRLAAELIAARGW